MSYTKYSDEFKLQVVQEYLEGALGCRLISQKYNLPSKNYIFIWKEQLLKKGLLTINTHKVISKGGVKNDYCKNKTAYEKQLERENLKLKVELAYLQELKKITDSDKKK